MKKVIFEKKIEKTIYDLAKKEKISINEEKIKDLAKSIYKKIIKTLQDKANKQNTDEIIDDIADTNYVAEVDQTKIPPKKEQVLWKNKDKLKNFLNNRKLKKKKN